MTHPAGPAPDPGHEDPQADAPVPDIPPVARPEHHRDSARRAVRTRELHLPAGRRIHTSRQRARPYDGHGRHTASDPSSPPRPNDARRDPSRSGDNPDHRPPGTTSSRHHERSRPNAQPECSGNQAVNTDIQTTFGLLALTVVVPSDLDTSRRRRSSRSAASSPASSTGGATTATPSAPNSPHSCTTSNHPRSCAPTWTTRSGDTPPGRSKTRAKASPESASTPRPPRSAANSKCQPALRRSRRPSPT